MPQARLQVHGAAVRVPARLPSSADDFSRRHGRRLVNAMEAFMTCGG